MIKIISISEYVKENNRGEVKKVKYVKMTKTKCKLKM